MVSKAQTGVTSRENEGEELATNMDDPSGVSPKRGQKIEMVTGGASGIEGFGKDGVKCHRWMLQMDGDDPLKAMIPLRGPHR